MQTSVPADAENPNPLWTIRLLGTLELERPDGTVISLRRTKAGELLARLALSPTKTLTRSHLAEVIWEQSDTLHTRTRLRQEIEKLLKLFREDRTSPLIASEAFLTLDSQSCSTDIAQFQQHLTSADNALTPVLQAEHLAAASALYRNDLLIEYLPAFEEERIQFRLLFEQAQYRLAEAFRLMGETAKAKTTLTRLLTLNPAREEAHCELMRLYAEGGQPSEVRRQYQELERVLQQEMGTKPTEAARRLRDHLLENGTDEFSVSSSRALSAPAPAAPLEIVPPVAARSQELSRRVALAIMTLLAIVAAVGWLRPQPNKPQTASPAKPEPKIVYGQELWTYAVSAAEDETPNSEAKTLAVSANNTLGITGIVQTKKSDTDFLTVALSAQGHQRGRVRFDSAGHDCDRAFSIVSDQKLGWYVAGHSYFPAGSGRKEGWYRTLVHYDSDLNQLWYKHSEQQIEKDEWVRTLPDGEGGVIVGATEQGDKNKRRLLLSRYDAGGNRRYETIYLPDNADAAWFRACARLPNGGFVVCGLAAAKARRADEERCWVTACFDTNGKLLWEKFCGEQSKSEPQGIETDQYGNIFVFGTLAEGDAKTGTLRSIPAIVKYDHNGKGGAVFSDPSYSGEIQITGWGVSALGGGGGVNLVGQRLTPTNEFAAFGLGFSKEGEIRWTHDYKPFWDFRSSVAKAVYVSGTNQFATVAEFSKQSAPFFQNASQMAVIWSNSEGHPLSIYLSPGLETSTKMNASASADKRIFLVGQTLKSGRAAFNVVAFPLALP